MEQAIRSITVLNDRPKTVDGQTVLSILDSYKAWPKWWLGYAQRSYFVVQLSGKTLEIYECPEGWFYSKQFD